VLQWPPAPACKTLAVSHKDNKMTVKILDAAPVSGQHPEFSFGQRFNYPLWTEFQSDNGDIWYGSFSKLWNKGFSVALIDNNGKTAFIVAGGQGFLIDTTNKKLIFETEEHPAIESAIKTNNPEYYIAGMFYSAYVINTNGEVKTIEPDFTTDGIFFSGQKDNKAVGRLDAAMNQYEHKYDFELDLETFQFALPKSARPSFWQKLFGQ
jgi:hypothetical protein